MNAYVISVSLGTGCYRHIQIAASATLSTLHTAILNAFHMEDDHAHAFFMDNHYWGPDAYFSMDPEGFGDRLTQKYRLSQLDLHKGSAFKYLFDFGDEWRFQCKVLREVDTDVDIPQVIRSVGENPIQYPDYEDWDELESEDPGWICIDEDDEDEDDDQEFMSLMEELGGHLLPDPKTMDTLARYFRAAATLYGIVPLETIFTLYNSQNQPLDEGQFLVAAAYILHDEMVCSVLPDLDDPWQSEVVYTLLLMDPERMSKVRKKQKDKPFCQLPREEFLSYDSADYLPKFPAEQRLYALLKEQFPRKKQQRECQDSYNLLIDALSLGFSFDEWVMALQHSVPKFPIQTYGEELMSLYKEVCANLRMIVHRGHTGSEQAACNATGKRLRKQPGKGQISLFPTDDPE